MTANRPTVGIVGAGQLARMSYAAAVAMDVRLRLLADRPADSAALVGRDVSVGSPSDPEALSAFAAECDVVTFDHELVPPERLAELASAGHVLRPDPGAMRHAQDKGHQRTTFAELGLPVPVHELVGSPGEVCAFGREHGWPVVLKAVRGGYDGRGVWTVGSEAEVAAAWPEAGAPLLLVEARVPIEKELAVVLVRRPAGEVAVYPLVETVQRDGICTELVVPARVEDPVRRAATALAQRIATVTGVTGVLAVELFWTGSELLINEVATRPHNSGHWTIEGARTSQFANHLRAVLDWPLGSTALTAAGVVTVNVLGPSDASDPAVHLPRALEVPDVAVHLYGKTPRPGRKLGHVTAWSDDLEAALSHSRQAAAILTGAAA